MPSAFLFIYGIVTLLTAFNGLRRPSPPSSRFPAIWLPAMLVGEAPWVYLFLRTAIAGGLVLAGGTVLPMGWLGLAMVGVAQLLQLEIARRGLAAAWRSPIKPVATPLWQRVTSWPLRIPALVERIEDVQFAPGLLTDIYRLRQRGEPAPTLIYVHGGSWGGGDPRRQFRTVTHHLATSGWVVLTIRYPLSPLATFPDHLVGVKQAIHWARTQGATIGIDPDRIALAGGSAGAHLAALAALSNGAHQPGFEDDDTSVTAAVVLYGIYDFLNRNRTRHDWPVIPTRVMKATHLEAPDLYRQASPIDLVHPDAPPFLVVHGTHDSLVPAAESRHFVEALLSVDAAVEYLPVLAAQHAFDVLGGIRTRLLAAQIERFLEDTLSRRHNRPAGGIIGS